MAECFRCGEEMDYPICLNMNCPLNQPQVTKLFVSPTMFQQLVKKGFITPEGTFV